MPLSDRSPFAMLLPLRHANVLRYDAFQGQIACSTHSAHIFSTDDYVRAYPVCAEWLITETLRTLAEDDGVPRELLTDNANINHDWTRGRVQQAGMVSPDRNALN